MDASKRQDGIMKMPDEFAAIPTAIIEDYPEHARMIGCIVAEWSQIEYRIIFWLSLSLGANNTMIMPMIYAIEASRARLDATSAAFLEVVKEEPARSELVAILEEAKSLLNQRNKFAHALYGISASGELAILRLRTDDAGDLPLYDLKHQFGRMKELSHKLAMRLKPIVERLLPTPSAAQVRPERSSGSDDARTDP